MAGKGERGRIGADLSAASRLKANETKVPKRSGKMSDEWKERFKRVVDKANGRGISTITLTLQTYNYFTGIGTLKALMRVLKGQRSSGSLPDILRAAARVVAETFGENPSPEQIQSIFDQAYYGNNTEAPPAPSISENRGERKSSAAQELSIALAPAAAVPKSFKQLMTNIEFMRAIDFSNVTRDQLIREAVGKAPHELQDPEDPSNIREMADNFARIFARESGHGDQQYAQAAYFQRIWNSCYPDILDSPAKLHQWVAISESSFSGSKLNDYRCAWVMPWINGRPIDNIILAFEAGDFYDETCLPAPLRNHHNDWVISDKTKRDQERIEYGFQVGIRNVQHHHHTNSYAIQLGQVKYLHYQSLHGDLSNGGAKRKKVRELAFENAVSGIARGEVSVLPSNFCLAMGVVSKDKYAIFKRRKLESIYGGMWEYCVGEFMHCRAAHGETQLMLLFLLDL